MSRSSKNERRYTSARERAEKQSSGFQVPYLKLPEGVTLFKPKAGVMLLDILPFVAGEGNPWADKGNLHWERTFYAHRGIGANNDSFLCARMSNKERCPICEARLALMKQGDESKEELIKELAPKQRQLFNVINLKDPDKGVQIWDFSYFLFGKVLDARIRNSDEEDNWGDFFHLEGGLTLKIGFVEKSFGGFSYCEVETIDFRPRKQDYDEDTLELVHCLDDILVTPEFDELKEVYLQTDAGKDDDEDEDKPKKKSSKPAADDDDDDEDVKPAKKKPAVSDDDEDDDDDEEPAPKKKKPAVDDDDEDEAPAPKKKISRDDDEDEDEAPPAKKKKPADDDDDWDDFDEKPAKKSSKPAADEDDDEEPAPKKKSKPVADDDEDEERPHIKTKKEMDDEEDEDEAPAPKKKKKPADDEDDD